MSEEVTRRQRKYKPSLPNPIFDRWAEAQKVIAQVRFPAGVVPFRVVAGQTLLHRCPRCDAWNTTNQFHKVVYPAPGKVTVEGAIDHVCGVSYTVSDNEGALQDDAEVGEDSGGAGGRAGAGDPPGADPCHALREKGRHPYSSRLRKTGGG